jgi:hypothetical protein
MVSGPGPLGHDGNERNECQLCWAERRYGMSNRRGRRPKRWVVLLPLVASATLSIANATSLPGLFGTSPTAIEVQSEPITAFDSHDPSRHRFGELDFRGGLSLKSTHRDFGGLSAIRFMLDGAHFVALSDRGKWLTACLSYEGKHPKGVMDAVMAPILGPDGYALAGRGWQDTESIADDNGDLYVGIEGANKILRFDFAKDGVRAHGRPIWSPPDLRTLPKNKGLEAMVFVPRTQPMGGTLVAISERGLDSAGNIRAFLIGGPAPGKFSIKRVDQFDVTDAALLPSGDVLILERSWSWPDGLLTQIRRVSLRDIKPDAVVDGAVIFQADLRLEIDNMEGWTVHRATNGEIVLTLISDDNFSALQRTEFLQFSLVGQ